MALNLLYTALITYTFTYIANRSVTGISVIAGRTMLASLIVGAGSAITLVWLN